MNDSPRDQTWASANQRYLMAALRSLRTTLEAHAAALAAPRRERGDTPHGVDSASYDAAAPAVTDEELEAARGRLPAPAALDVLSGAFALSSFERAIVLMCAGVELDASFASLCAAAKGNAHRPYPTFSLALAALPDAHWSALTPGAPLRQWRLIEPIGAGAAGAGAGSLLTTCPLRIDERILHFLAGVSQLDERLTGVLEPIDASAGGELPPSQQGAAAQIVSAWTATPGDAPAAVQLCGDDRWSNRAIVTAACQQLRWPLCVMPASLVPQSAAELDLLLRLCEREAALTGCALLVEVDDVIGNSGDSSATAVRNWIERYRGALVVASREPLPGVVLRARVAVHARKPTRAEQAMLWQRELGPTAQELDGELDGELDALISQFDLGATAIRSAALQARDGHNPTSLGARLWETCREQSRPRLDDLAQRIECVASIEDLVLPDRALRILREIALHVRHRATVYERWGFADKCARGLGIGALFCGPSGTGKTLAAEILARELRLDLYRIDISQVVSKYIGETEKNLRRVFDAAEEGGAVLLFDEADALFGKRSEVRDSHDRYANIEVSYLLQRIEAYRGLAILTTNMKDALDPAFLRRLRFVVHFPFPDLAQRAEIWRRIFPRQTPLEDVDAQRLARMSVAGGNIRNIAMGAAFAAAAAGEPVRMTHLATAARAEYAKLEKPLDEAWMGGCS